MHLRSKRKVDGKSAEPEEHDERNEPGPSQSKPRRESSRSKAKSSKQADAQTSLQLAKNDAIFGHYWRRFERRVRKDMAERIQQSETSSNLSHLNEYISSRGTVIKVTEGKSSLLESTVATFSTTCNAKTYSEDINIVEQNVECESGISLQQQQTEPHRTIKSLLTSFEGPSTSKELLHDVPLDLTVKKNIGWHISSPNTEASCSELNITEERQCSTKDLNLEKQIQEDESKTNRNISRRLRCGICDTDFGHPAAVFRKLIFKHIENKQTYTLKCICCSMVIKDEDCIYMHIVKHFEKGELFCMKCQMESKYGKVIYDLETPYFSQQVVPFVETQKLLLHLDGRELEIPKLTPESERALSEISACCGMCKTPFVDVSNMLLRLIQFCFDSSKVKRSKVPPIFCCIICGKTTYLKPNIEKHLLTHFQCNVVLCQFCYNQQPSQSIPEISTVQVIRSAARLQEFDRSKKINCGKCTEYLADTVVLDPLPLAQYVITIRDDNLKISDNRLYKCHICHQSFVASSIKDHIFDHIKDDRILCRTCFKQDQKGFAFIQRRLFSKMQINVTVSCPKCNKSFYEECFKSRCSAFILHSFVDANLKYLFLCEVCKRMFTVGSDCLNHIKEHITDENLLCSVCTNETKGK